MAGLSAEKLTRWWSDLQSRRANFDTHWQDVGRYVWPNQQDFTSTRSQGEKKNFDVFDDTATENSKKYAAVMEALLTRRSSRWHKLVARDKHLRESAAVRDYFDQVEEILFAERESRDSGCYAACAQCYRSLGVFGNDCLFVDDRMDEGKRFGLRYKAIDLRDVWVARDWQDGVAAVFRRYRLPCSQLAEKFGPERIPQNLLERASVHPFEEIELLTCVYKNPEHTPASIWSKKWLAAELLTQEKVIVGEGGYEENPFIFSRAEVAPGEEYGRGPAMDVLPTIKTLNEMVKTMIRTAHKVADPPLLVANDGVLGVTQAVRLRPGALTRGGMDLNGKRLVEPLYTGGNIGINLEMLSYFREKIDAPFLVNLFTLLVERPQMTAAEILERSSEKGTFVGPIVGSQQTEKLAPMIEREIGCLARQRRLPKAPPELMEAGGEYALEYETPAAQMQRAGEVGQLESALQSVILLGQVDPSALEVADLQEAARTIMSMRGVKSTIIRDKRQVEKIRAVQMQQAQQQQALEALPVVAKGARDLAEAAAVPQPVAAA